MNRILVKCLLAAVTLLGGIVWLQHQNTVRLKGERDRYRSNSTALLSEVRRIRVDSATIALDTRTLQLTLDEYRRFREEDAATIRRLGVKVKNLEAAARHEMEVAGPINAAVRDTVVIRDTVPLLRQKVEMITPHIHLTGLIEEGRLKGEIRVPVTAGRVGRVQGLVVLETGKGRTSDRFERQSLCGNKIFGIHPD